MGTLVVSSETAFTQSPHAVYDFVSDPRNWTRTYPSSAHIEGVDRLPLEIGDVWVESGEGEEAGSASWRLITAEPGRKFVFQSVGLLPRKGRDAAGFEGLMTIAYTFSEPGEGVTLFHRSMTIELPKHAEIPAEVLAVFEPRFIDAYHAAIARLLDEDASAS